jgi:hypothetical protein
MSRTDEFREAGSTYIEILQFNRYHIITHPMKYLISYVYFYVSTLGNFVV